MTDANDFGADAYQRMAARTSGACGARYHAGDGPGSTGRERLLCGLVGLGGESGELLDLLKKHLYHGHPLDVGKVMKEAGDVAWYLAEVCDALGLSLAAVLRLNEAKLRARYPEGFDAERSQNRPEGV